MSARLSPPRKVLAVAGADDSQIALESALDLARTHDAALEVLACVEAPHDLSLLSRLSGSPPEQLLEDAAAYVRDTVRARLDRLAPDRDVPLSVAVGKAYMQIIRHVAASGCDFVVKTAEPLAGLERFLFSSTDQHLLRKCPCPVWLQTEGAARAPKRVLAAVDLDTRDADEPETLAALNRRVVDAACLLARGADAEVIVLHAWDAMGEGMVWAFSGSGGARMSSDRYINEILAARSAEMDRFLADRRAAIGPTPRLAPLLTRGTPETVLHAQSQALGADVVVMGTVARTGLGGVFIGNTAENIINSLGCPVLAVKPDGFVSPLLRD